MYLVDSSAWIAHLKGSTTPLSKLLTDNEVLVHPFIVGELSCGTLKNREEFLSLMSSLPSTLIADHQEVLILIKERKLYGSGIGWIDAHLLVSCLLTNAKILTYDKALSRAAKKLKIN